MGGKWEVNGNLYKVTMMAEWAHSNLVMIK